MPGHDIITIGASAGGVEATLAIASRLPADLPAAVFIVIHISASRPSLLPEILRRSSPMQVSAPSDGEPIVPGHIYVAPADNHLLVEQGFVRVVRGAKENGHRPAVDPLFRTAARAYGERVVGVVLTGMRDCGTVGLEEVKRHGGIAVVQDPANAMFPSMPQSALDNVEVDHCVDLEAIPALLEKLVNEPAKPAVARESLPEIREPEEAFTCPDCGGNMTRTPRSGVLAFSCKVGHRFAPEGLAASQAEALEIALWTALRAIEDNTALSRRLMQHAEARKQSFAAAQFQERVRRGEMQAALVRRALIGPDKSDKIEVEEQPLTPAQAAKS